MFIKTFRLQAASKYARQTSEFVNLYSKTRGCNRFPALTLTLKMLRRRPEVIARAVAIADTRALDDWIARESRLGNDALAAEIQSGNQALAPFLAWSKAVNAAVADMVSSVPPFPLVRECLEKLTASADAMVISQTPGEALRREWEENKMDTYVKFIAGQEMGTKGEHLKWAAGGKYPRENTLMIGDAPGDYKAAKSNQALFFPVVPGHEERSWQRLLEEGLDRFFAGAFAGAYEKELLAEFDASLPATPPWEEAPAAK